MVSRLQHLRSQFSSLGINAFLVNFQPHVRYMTGFSGSNGIGLITENGQSFITDGRYVEQARKEVKGWKIFITQDSLFEEVRLQRLLHPGMRVGIDGNTFILSQFKQIKKIFPKVKFLPKVETIEKISAVKDEEEIKKITKAVTITDVVFGEILPLLKPGVRELEIAAEISYRQRVHGAEGDAFDTIVASGERGSMPHGQASSKKIRKGEMVTLDFGSIVEGYHSDLTRTVAVGKPPAEATKIYTIVLDAQCRAIDSAVSGMKAKDLDGVAREHIKHHGYEKFFRHSLGHGLGLQIHEAPRISFLSKATLVPGNVVTIEPGIYLPGFGGVRIEDDIVVRAAQCEVLNRAPKELLIL
jgi:Xaa-Pro aminopeptidase